MFKTKSIRTNIDPAADGLRILATRFRGRGLRKSHYDVWMANLGPSERLLRAFRTGQISWPAFSTAYRAEMFELDGHDQDNQVIRNCGQKFTLRLLQHLAQERTITLLCHCAEEETACHRHLLRRLLERRI